MGRNVLKSMDPCTVLIIKWPKPFKTRYFKNLLPDLQITFCKSCLKVYQIKYYSYYDIINKLNYKEILNI